MFGGLGQLLGRSFKREDDNPDITYDPTGSTLFSARTPELAQLGNRYVQNPTSREFIGVDPAQFGFPEDRTVRPVFNPNFRVNSAVGGAVNPAWQVQRGFTPTSLGEGPRNYSSIDELRRILSNR